MSPSKAILESSPLGYYSVKLLLNMVNVLILIYWEILGSRKNIEILLLTTNKQSNKSCTHRPHIVQVLTVDSSVRK